MKYPVGAVVTTRRLYLDPATALPLAEETERGGAVPTTRSRAVWSAEFIPVDALPADFFDPVALRGLRLDPQTVLDRPPPGFTVYWLGARFPGATGVPPLELRKVGRAWPTDRPPTGRLYLFYHRPEDPDNEQPLLLLTEYSRAVWDAYPSAAHYPRPEGACWTQQDVTLPQGRATLFLGFFPTAAGVEPSPGNCPTDRPHDRFLAYVYLGETVVVVSIGGRIPRIGTREGLEEIVRALQPHAP